MSVPCRGNCDGKNEGKEVEFAPGVKSILCGDCSGQFQADIRADLKAYGFKADKSATEQYDELKGIG